MNCESIRERMDDWLDAEPGGTEAGAIRDHLAGCEGCRRHEAAARRLREALDELPRDIDPPRDLWDGIRPRVVPDDAARPVMRTPRWALASVAASVILAVALGVVVLRDTRVPSPGPQATGPPADSASVAILASYDAAEDEFGETRDLLLAELESNRDRLDPETVEVVEDNLAIMERAAAEIREALEHDPENRMLRSMLLASYRKQVGLLKHFGEIPSEL